MLCEKCCNIHHQPYLTSVWNIGRPQHGPNPLLTFKLHDNHDTSKNAFNGCSLCQIIDSALRAQSQKRWDTSGHAALETGTNPSQGSLNWDGPSTAPVYMGIQTSHWGGPTVFTLIIRWEGLEGRLLLKTLDDRSNKNVISDRNYSLHESQVMQLSIPEQKIKLARYWLHNCRATHSACRNIQEDSVLPSRVLDVCTTEHAKIIYGGTEAEYVTLSYKWGSGKKFLMTSVNKEALESGFNPDILPKTFREAIWVTHALGFRYLWVDALCIEQDSPEHCHEQINLMDRIFRGSSLTLFAAAAEHADAGLGLATAAAWTPDLVPIDTKGSSLPSIRQAFVCPADHFDHDYNDQSLHTRGWVLQEEVLSRCGLSFWSDQIRWRCDIETLNEREPFPKARTNHNLLNEHANVRPDHNLWPLLTSKPSTDPLVDIRAHLADQNLTNFMLQWQVLRAWYSMVSYYSQRQLSFPSDALNGVAGIASLILEKYNWTYLAGLWSPNLSESLLWKPHRHSEKSSREISPTFASWTWASQLHKGPIRWQFSQGKQMDREAYVQYQNYSEQEQNQGTLKVQAYARWAQVEQRLPGKPPSAYCLQDSAVQNKDQIFDSNIESKTRFIPDDPKERSFLSGRTKILCILCYRFISGSWGPRYNHALAVVSAPDQPGKYRRVGLVEYLPRDWFGSIDTCRDSSTPHDDRMILELI